MNLLTFSFNPFSTIAYKLLMLFSCAIVISSALEESREKNFFQKSKNIVVWHLSLLIFWYFYKKLFIILKLLSVQRLFIINTFQLIANNSENEFAFSFICSFLLFSYKNNFLFNSLFVQILCQISKYFTFYYVQLTLEGIIHLLSRHCFICFK